MCATVGLLDPRWIENQRKQMQEKKNEEAFSGVQVKQCATLPTSMRVFSSWALSFFMSFILFPFFFLISSLFFCSLLSLFFFFFFPPSLRLLLFSSCLSPFPPSSSPLSFSTLLLSFLSLSLPLSRFLLHVPTTGAGKSEKPGREKN